VWEIVRSAVLDGRSPDAWLGMSKLKRLEYYRRCSFYFSGVKKNTRESQGHSTDPSGSLVR